MRQENEIEHIRFLKNLTGHPLTFLQAQNELLYEDDLSRFQHGASEINTLGLPAPTEAFYTAQEPVAPSPLSSRIPRVLNIGSGGEERRKLPAINIDVSSEGQPEVIADGRHLPFKDDTFSLVRASHILEHIDQEELVSTLREWRRVLHPDGELVIAVPDADVAFQEIIRGVTPKGQPAFSYEKSSAPLAQIYGLGYDNPNTDRRWLHKIIFNFSLLEYYLKSVGFTNIERRVKEVDLAALAQVDDDSQNHYTLSVAARNERKPHQVEDILTEKEYQEKCRAFKERQPDTLKSTYIVPVHNEEKNLPHFLSFLQSARNTLSTEREFIFVVNGSQDRSEAILQKYIDQGDIPAQLISSERGIIRAFKKGIEARSHDGFIGKIDADTLLHPHALDLMEMYLAENQTAQVTYAEPTPIDSQFTYNEAEHNPPIRSKRLYIHGRLSLYRDDPFAGIPNGELFDQTKAEDIFLSFYYSYYFGLDAICQTPHALVYSKTVKNLDDLVSQLSRNASELKRVFDVYPPFRALDRLLEREIYPGNYHSAIKEAKKQVQTDVEDWTRLDSTK